MDPFTMGYPVMAPPRHRPASQSVSSHSRSTSQASTLAGSNVGELKAIAEDKAPATPETREEEMDRPSTLAPFLRLPLRDSIKTIFLLALSLLAAPITYAVALLFTALPSSWISFILPFSPTTPTAATAHRALCRAEPNFSERTILVTGVGMTKGLTLARAFWLCGHRVVAADFDAERCSAWTPWKRTAVRGWTFSRAFDTVYSLRRPEITENMDEMERMNVRREYVQDIGKIVLDEDVDLWVSCSGVASAVEDAMVQEALESSAGGGRQAKGRACIQFDVPTTEMLHEKSSFIRQAKKLDLSVPETHDVYSHNDVLQALTKAMRRHPERRFILKPVGMDDANRGDMTLLPLATHWDTDAHVQRLPISKERPWILQQFIHGNKEYCTHSLVVNGEVKAFVACPSSELLMHYNALAAEDPLSKDMLDFTKRFADSERNTGKTFTGHLSFDFMAEKDEKTATTRLYAIECNPRAHTAVALFATPGTEMRAMVEAYISASTNPVSSIRHPKHPQHVQRYSFPGVVRPPPDAVSRYWVGHDLVASLLLPLKSIASGPTMRAELIAQVKDFWEHLSSWKDGTFEMWDPWPFVALYHHYWPRAILDAWLKGERWSRVNVSTTKMFAC